MLNICMKQCTYKLFGLKLVNKQTVAEGKKLLQILITSKIISGKHGMSIRIRTNEKTIATPQLFMPSVK